jgi:hypothetical protein
MLWATTNASSLLQHELEELFGVHGMMMMLLIVPATNCTKLQLANL